MTRVNQALPFYRTTKKKHKQIDTDVCNCFIATFCVYTPVAHTLNHQIHTIVYPGWLPSSALLSIMGKSAWNECRYDESDAR